MQTCNYKYFIRIFQRHTHSFVNNLNHFIDYHFNYWTRIEIYFELSDVYPHTWVQKIKFQMVLSKKPGLSLRDSAGIFGLPPAER